VVSIYGQRDDHFPLKSWLQVTYPFLKAACFDTFCLVAPQPQEIQQEGQHPLTGQRAPPIWLKMTYPLLKAASFDTYRGSSVPYKGIGIKESNDDVRT